MMRLVLGSCLLGLLAAPARAEDQAVKDKASPAPPTLLAQLSKPITLDRGIDANTQLKDALEFLADKLEVTLVVNNKAFQDVGIAELEAQPVRLPKLKEVKLGSVLRMVLNQVNATILVTPEYIEVVPGPGAIAATGAKPGFPLVHTVFQNRNLDQALRELSELSDVTILLDSERVEQKGQKAVTASLKRVPVDTAVQLLADMAGLKAVTVDGVLYVTTPENAEKMPTKPVRAKPIAKPQ